MFELQPTDCSGPVIIHLPDYAYFPDYTEEEFCFPQYERRVGKLCFTIQIGLFLVLKVEEPLKVTILTKNQITTLNLEGSASTVEKWEIIE